MIPCRLSLPPQRLVGARALSILLLGSSLTACSTLSRLAPESVPSGEIEQSRVQADGRLLDGRARGRFEPVTAQASSASNTPVAAYARDQPAPGSTNALAASSIEHRWRPARRAGDRDGDGVSDALDRCPETAAHVTVNARGCGLFDAVLEQIVFDSGSHWLAGSARSQLDQLAETLLAFPESRIRILAHTDSDGDARMNLTLSQARADAVVQYLKSRGVDARQLQGVGMGETRPLMANNSVIGRERNRRVEVQTLPDRDAGALPEPVVPRLPTQPEQQLAGNRDSEQALAQTVARRSVDSEPAMQAAVPAKTSGSRAKRRSPPILPLPEPGFAPGVRISGIVRGLGFDEGSAQLAADARQALEPISRTLLDNPGVDIVVMAHTDDIGDAQLNLQLSRQRAQAVVEYLVSRGVAQDRLDAEGYGELLPLVQNVTAADRARNRRVEIRIQRN